MSSGIQSHKQMLHLDHESPFFWQDSLKIIPMQISAKGWQEREKKVSETIWEDDALPVLVHSCELTVIGCYWAQTTQTATALSMSFPKHFLTQMTNKTNIRGGKQAHKIRTNPCTRQEGQETRTEHHLDWRHRWPLRGQSTTELVRIQKSTWNENREARTIGKTFATDVQDHNWSCYANGHFQDTGKPSSPFRGQATRQRIRLKRTTWEHGKMTKRETMKEGKNATEKECT